MALTNTVHKEYDNLWTVCKSRIIVNEAVRRNNALPPSSMVEVSRHGLELREDEI
jgi:hypothetical protein